MKRALAVAALLVLSCSRRRAPAPAAPSPPAPAAAATAAATLAAHPGPDAASATPDPRAATLDAMLRASIPADGPGAAVAVALHGHSILARGYGLADLASQTPITTRTRFDLASVSKQFTAMVLARLQQRGLVRLTDDVRKYLPSLPVFDARRPLRVADLAHMTSGLPDYTEALDDFDDPAHLGNDDVVTWAAQQRLGFPTGTRFEYCNTNYVLLARVLEVAGKRRFAELLAAEVLRPLGMTSVVLDQARVIPERAQGYQRAGRGWTPVRDDVPVTGDGNLFASLDDLQRWDRGLSTLLPPDDLAALLTPGQLDSGTAHDYALGWTIGGEPDHRVADHSGAWTGTATYIARHLDDGLTIIILSNDEGFDLELADRIAAVMQPALP